MLNFINTAAATALARVVVRGRSPQRLGVTKRWAVYLELGRPFTLLAPALGFLSGGADRHRRGAAGAVVAGPARLAAARRG